MHRRPFVNGRRGDDVFLNARPRDFGITRRVLTLNEGLSMVPVPSSGEMSNYCLARLFDALNGESDGISNEGGTGALFGRETRE